MTGEVHRILFDLLAARLAPAARAWLEAEVAATQGFDEARFTRAFTSAARRVGGAAVALGAAERAALDAAGVEQPLEGYGVDELARAALLAAAVAGASDEVAVARARRAYDDGDNRERVAVLRALPILPGPARFVALGVEACRSHVSPIFAAIACDNTYPARHFGEAAFNQMALKVAFVELPLGRVLLLATRRSPELERMAREYAAERTAAGRSVPSDLPLLFC